MKKSISIAIALLLSAGGFSQENQPTLVHGINQFGLELYAQLRPASGNIFFSPYSISSAMAMVYAGARGNTLIQMSKVLHFDTAQQNVHPTFSQLNKELKSRAASGLELQIANMLWVQQNYQFLTEYYQITQNYYESGLRSSDFVENTEKSRLEINQQVELFTQGKIKNLLPQGAVSQITRAVITNAIYFKANWQTMFDERLSYKAPFYAPQESPEVGYMQQEGLFNYYGDDSVQVIEIPYTGNTMSMVVVLPVRRDGLVQVEKKLSIASYEQWISRMNVKKVELVLPKFTLRWQQELSTVLTQMGMVTPFTNNADFSGMTGKLDLAIDKVFHQAFVEVNEKGTEAAAATAVVIREKSLPMTLRFAANHPFLFFIRDRATNCILFSGRVENPANQ